MYARETGKDGIGCAHTLDRSQSDSVKAPNSGRFDSRRGILDDDALTGWQVELTGSVDEKIGRGFLPLDAVTIGDSVKEVANAKSLNYLARILARRTECRFDTRPTNLVQEFLGAGK